MHVFLRNLLPQFFGKDIPFLNFQCRETNDVVVMFSRTRNVRFSNKAIICQLLSLFLICWPVEQYWPAILEFSHDHTSGSGPLFYICDMWIGWHDTSWNWLPRKGDTENGYITWLWNIVYCFGILHVLGILLKLRKILELEYIRKRSITLLRNGTGTKKKILEYYAHNCNILLRQMAKGKSGNITLFWDMVETKEIFLE